MDNKILPVLQHRAALPWCYCDGKKGKIVLRLLASDDVEKAILLHGDPYDWGAAPSTPFSEKTWKWQFKETPLHQQFSGADPGAWRIELDVPVHRRLKYGFKVKTSQGEFYFSENGVAPYKEAELNRPHNHFFYHFVHEVDFPPAPAWVEQTVWYQIFPERFCRKVDSGAITPPNIENWEKGKVTPRSLFGGNLAGIRDKLPWLADLGINGIYLTPVFKSPSTHKYNTEDYYTIDPHFGTLDELKALVSDAHSLNMRVMLDAVFNHVGDTHPFWQDVLKNQEKSQYKDYFHIRRFPVRKPNALTNYRDLDYHAFAWVAGMPKWNTENPDARKYLLDAAAYWIKECDIDGWRLDVANEVSFDFWKEFSKEVRSLKKDFYILGEIWHDGSSWINPGLFDSTMNYQLDYAISDCFIKKEMTPHDFAIRLLKILTRYSDLHNRLCFNLLDSHDTERALTRAKGNKLAMKNAFTMMFLLPGCPCVYYGTEVGMEGAGDPDCRRPMIWDEKLQDKDMLHFFKRLLKFRKEYLAIINNPVLKYESNNDFHRWDLSGAEGQLIAVYSEKTVRNFSSPGVCVFGPNEDLKQYQTGELSPDTLIVFFRRNV